MFISTKRHNQYDHAYIIYIFIYSYDRYLYKLCIDHLLLIIKTYMFLYVRIADICTTIYIIYLLVMIKTYFRCK